MHEMDRECEGVIVQSKNGFTGQTLIASETLLDDAQKSKISYPKWARLQTAI